MNYFVEVKEDLSSFGLPKGCLAEIVIDDVPRMVADDYDAIVVKNLQGTFTLLERHQYRYLDDTEDFDIQKAKILSALITLIVLVLSIYLLA